MSFGLHCQALPAVWNNAVSLINVQLITTYPYEINNRIHKELKLLFEDLQQQLMLCFVVFFHRLCNDIWTLELSNNTTST